MNIIYRNTPSRLSMDLQAKGMGNGTRMFGISIGSLASHFPLSFPGAWP